jgi:hypothetical protein
VMLNRVRDEKLWTPEAGSRNLVGASGYCQ